MYIKFPEIILLEGLPVLPGSLITDLNIHEINIKWFYILNENLDKMNFKKLPFYGFLPKTFKLKIDDYIVPNIWNFQYL